MKQKDKRRRICDKVGGFLRKSRFLSFDWHSASSHPSPVSFSLDAIDVAPEAIIGPVCEVAIVKKDKRRKKGRDTHDHVKIAREKPVLQNAPVGDVDALALIRHNDHRPT